MHPAKTLFLSFCLFALPALAQEDETPVEVGTAPVTTDAQFLSKDEIAAHKDTIAQVEKYLTGLTTIVADFTQTAPDGTVATGRFFLQRPGKMRWQYNPPTPVLIIMNGKQMVYFDAELEQVNYIPIDSTLISFLGRGSVRFNGNVGIQAFEEAAGVIRITIAQQGKPDEGNLTLEFSDAPLALRSMVITDPNRQVTLVALNNAQFGMRLDKSLFIFNDPRKMRRKT